MLKKIKGYEIEYTNDDVEYIDLFSNTLLNRLETILDFFEIPNLPFTIKIKLWNNLDSYRSYYNSFLKKYGKEVPEWEIGRAANETIGILSLKEQRKCKGHKNSQINDILDLGAHESVHIVHFSLIKNSIPPTWLSEGIATFLANQYTDNNFFTNTIDEIIMGKASYSNYRLIVIYILEEYGKDHLLKLLTNYSLSKDEERELLKKAIEHKLIIKKS